MSVLEKINYANDIKNIEKNELPVLADEIRGFIIDKVSRTGGHLASNLGVVEITMALHLCMEFPKDKIIWDVGHQSYTHKILTGRKEGFDNLRQYGGMSGFPKRNESDSDAFNTGHSSTSISAALGFAKARDLTGSDARVVAVIGDGSLTGGMAYEALNFIARAKTGCLIVLNDNEMSIDKNVGGMSRYLTNIRVGHTYNDLKSSVENKLLNIPDIGYKLAKKIKRSKDSIKNIFVPSTFFDDMGITYLGPVDGHNIFEMAEVFEKAFRLNRPIVVHVKTKKGKGYKYAEKYPEFFHGVEPFDIVTGKPVVKKTSLTYTDVFAKKLVEIGEKNDKVVAITAAMAHGTGISHFQKKFPERTFDVGIAEQNAVTFAAGLAAAGMIPVVAIYSSFLQRAYDQILHDVCLQGLHVVFAVDRSGLVGPDGATHHGIYDTSFLSEMPGMTVIAPKNAEELKSAMEYAIKYNGPVAVKYPKGTAFRELSEFNSEFVHGKSEKIFEGNRVALIGCGSMVKGALEVYKKLNNDDISAGLYNARFLNPIDYEMIDEITEKYEMIAVLEENVAEGSYGEHVAEYLMEKGKEIKFEHFCIHSGIVEHGKIPELKKELGIDSDSIYKEIKDKIDIGDSTKK